MAPFVMLIDRRKLRGFLSTLDIIFLPTDEVSLGERFVNRILLTALIPGRVLRYISDGDVRSPLFGLKFAI